MWFTRSNYSDGEANNGPTESVDADASIPVWLGARLSKTPIAQTTWKRSLDAWSLLADGAFSPRKVTNAGR